MNLDFLFIFILIICEFCVICIESWESNLKCQKFNEQKWKWTIEGTVFNCVRVHKSECDWIEWILQKLHSNVMVVIEKLENLCMKM